MAAQYYRGDKTFQTLDKTAVGLSNVDNTSDANKPLSNAENSALALKADTTTLALKANLASPTFTGTVTVPTPTSGTSAANKSYVDSLVGVTATDLNIPTTTSLSVGTIRQNGTRLIHTYGSSNLFIGLGSGNYSTTGGGNITLGGANLVSNTTGQENLALGISALQNNTTGDSNTASGRYSLVYNTTGSSNTAIGVASLLSNTTGSSNTAIGTSSLFSNVTGSNNIGIGAAADVVANNLTNAIVIGSTATVNASNKIRLGNTLITAFDCQVALTVTSDIRTKGSIEDLNQGLAFVNSLRPVSYEMNSDPSKKTYYGFIAQEVQAALPKDTSIVSVVGKHSDNTDLLGVRYQDLIAPLYKAVKSCRLV